MLLSINITCLIFLTIVISFSAVAQNKKNNIPNNWKKIEAYGITFYAPSELEEEKIRGTDSCVKRYRSKNILLSIDVLGYKLKKSASRRDEYADEVDFQIVKTKINGRNAEIITHFETDNSEQWKGLPFSATLFVPQMRKDCCNLTMWTNNSNEEERELSKRIFQTIIFDN